MIDLNSASFPHGTSFGFAHGCRSRGGCLFHESAHYLTCAEAAAARRRDFAVARLPEWLPVARDVLDTGETNRGDNRAGRALVHGTTWGYQRGCRSPRDCPEWRAGRLSCTEARQRYAIVYRTERAEGRGTTITHGTSNGYLLGCRNSALCPGGQSGETCSEARSRYRRDRARMLAPAVRPPLVNATAATQKIRQWVEDGMSLRRIATLTGVGRTTIAALADPGRSGRTEIADTTCQRILDLER